MSPAAGPLSRLGARLRQEADASVHSGQVVLLVTTGTLFSPRHRNVKIFALLTPRGAWHRVVRRDQIWARRVRCQAPLEI